MAQAWNPSLPALTDMKGFQINVLETFIEYDGPVLFTTKIGFETYLVSKSDMLGTDYIFIASSITDEVLKLVRDNKLSILGAFRSGDFILIEASGGLVVNRHWPIDINCVPSEYLPEPNKPVSFDIDLVPDTVDQAKSYFSIRLSGPELSRESMSFHQFKKLIEKAYFSVRNLLAPNELRLCKSQVYDFKISQPEFGSLIINIEEPYVPSDRNIKKHFSTSAEEGEPDKAYVQKRFLDTRKHTMENLASLKYAAADGELSDGEMTRLNFVVRDVVSILPEAGDIYSDVEFYSNVDGVVNFLRITEADAGVIQSAYERHRNKPTNVIGKISIINAGTNKVVLKVLGNKEITCVFDPASFEQMALEQEFKTGSLLTVYGIVKGRKRRDYMECFGRGEISLPQQDQIDIFG